MTNRFHEAVARCRVQQVKSMLSSGVAINCKNSQGEPVLLQALRIDSAIKRRRMFTFLLHHGADGLDVDTNTGRDVLTWACVLARTDQVKHLLKSAPGAFDFKRKDLMGNTALHYGVESRDAGVVKTLAVEMNRLWVSVDILNDSGLTPYLLANKLGLQSIADILRIYGRASPHQFDPKTFKDSRDWYSQGKQERRRVIHKRVVSEIKRNGGLKFFKLPPMQNGSDPALRRSDTEIGVWLRLAPRKVTPVKVIINGSEDSPALPAIPDASSSHQSPSDLPQPVSSALGLNRLLDSYKEQLSTSYRVAAIPPPPEEKKPEVSLGSLSSFTMVIANMKARAAKSRKKVNLAKVASEALKNQQKGKRLNRRESLWPNVTKANGMSQLSKMKKTVSLSLPSLHLQSTGSKGH